MKKTEFITFRTDEDTKKFLDAVAENKKWTISFLVENIIKDWLKKKQNNAVDTHEPEV